MSSVLVDVASVERALHEGEGAGVHVAVIDSGIWFGDERLGSSCKGNSYSYVKARTPRHLGGDTQKDRRHYDSLGHGTDVAAIIHHYAPKALLNSYRVFAGRREGKYSLICQALSDAVDDGCQLLNCSVGTRSTQVFAENDHLRLSAYKYSLDKAFLAGAHVVAAGSNVHIAFEEWPAYFSSVLGVRCDNAVSALDINFYEGHMLPFGASGGNEPDPEGGRFSGTSYATARVTGLLARLLSVWPNLTPNGAAAALTLYASRKKDF